jgi:cell division protein FtsL
MFRLNLFLLLIVVLCALAVVTSQHRGRKLFQALEAEQEKVRRLDVEFGQLQIEMSTWATHPRVEKIARDRLRMVVPPMQQAAKPAPAATTGEAR